ncbi:MAG: quinolinate synthase NadA [Acidobacteriota bacterium]|jgi:quinolinate synthase
MHPRHLPEAYQRLSDEEASARIPAVREALGRRVVLLGHHYQRDDVIAHVDHTGDSYGLAMKAVANEDAETIVFCGVHFMAESADILSRDSQQVILPDHEAGCSLADMADLEDVELAWEDLTAIAGEGAVMPVTYINSGADLKAFVGENGGTVCTSANAASAFRWSLERRGKVFFFPDQHLGRNTALAHGVPAEEMILWDPARDLGGNPEGAIRDARVILWKGHCSVHTRFQAEHVRLFREQIPGIRILVHPECTREVVELADAVGSTSYIIRQVEEAEPGTRWAIGTELHLVNRLKQAHPEQFIASLVPGVCLCATMNRIDPQHLLWVLERLDEGETVNRVEVPEAIARRARLALDRMLAIR